MTTTQRRQRATVRTVDLGEAAGRVKVRTRRGYNPGGLPMIDEFCGLGGNSWGASLVPGIEVIKGYNHKELAARSWELNHPGAEGVCADVTKYPVEQMPWCAHYAGSPICPPFAKANGLPRLFDSRSANQPSLVDGLAGAEDTRTARRQAEHARGRLLMYEPLRYLRHWVGQGRPVLTGFLENVPEARDWAEWAAFLGEFDKLDYDTYLHAVRSDHVTPVLAMPAHQARNRLYLAFVHRSLNRRPDWDKWVRPNCWCPTCDAWVLGVKRWKNPLLDMGAYGEQYVFVCPNHAGKAPVVVEPETRPALAFLDTTDRGVAIGDPIRFQRSRFQPVADATIMRVAGGVIEHWLPKLAADPMADLLPMIASYRGGGDSARCRSSVDPLSVVSAQGRHHGAVFPPELNEAEMRSWAKALLVPYYGSATGARSTALPIGTLTTKPRYGVARVDDFDQWLAGIADAREVAATNVRALLKALSPKGTVTPGQRKVIDGMRDLLAPVKLRMLSVDEHKDFMAFGREVQSVATNLDDWILLLGNAVTPPVAEVLTSALVECITGEDLPREAPRELVSA